MLDPFGSGVLYGKRNDTAGIGADQFAILQDVTWDFKAETKQLRGQFQWAVDIARGNMSGTFKAKFARIGAALYADLFFGVTPATGSLTTSFNEPANVPASTPYTVTVANAATFYNPTNPNNDGDLGVYYASTINAGQRFSRVTTPSAAGQYSLNPATGVYTFAAPDANAAVQISYLYSSATAGKKLTITNQLMGVTPTFQGNFYTSKTTYGVAGMVCFVANQCTSSSFQLPTKLEDFTISEFDAEVFADGSGTIGYLSASE